MEKLFFYCHFSHWEGREGQVRDGKEKFGLGDEIDEMRVCCIRKGDSEVVLRRVSVIPCSSGILILKLNREGREGRVRKEKFALGDEIYKWDFISEVLLRRVSVMPCSSEGREGRVRVVKAALCFTR